MIVRLTYDDGKTEDHELKNGVHFADYIRRVDVPESKFAFALRQPAGPLPRGDAEAAGRGDQDDRAGEGPGPHRADRDGDDGRDAVK